MSFLVGALHHGQQVWLQFDHLPKIKTRESTVKPDREGLIQRVIAFVSAGLSAPR
jgi:hypothetical protein